MRVLSCKVHCPSCFCKPSSHLLTPCPLTLENSSIDPTTTEVGVDKGCLDEKIENLQKSSLKKPNSEARIPVEKARVQWLDLLGKDLVEIKEFEPSESGESDDEDKGIRGCVCVIQ